MAAMAAKNPNFVAEQHAVYEAAHTEAAARSAQPGQPDADTDTTLVAQAIADQNATSFRSAAPFLK